MRAAHKCMIPEADRAVLGSQTATRQTEAGQLQRPGAQQRERSAL